MAGRNGTGPLGMGPMTGRGFGPCNNRYSTARTRFGGGRRIRGRYGCFNPYLYESYPIDESMETGFLENEKTFLESRLKDINNILGEIGKED